MQAMIRYVGLPAGVSVDFRPCTGVPAFCHLGQAPLPHVLAVQGQNTKPARSVTRKQKKLTLNCFKHLHPTRPAKRTENPIPACYNANGKSARKEMWRQAAWRASPDVPCRHSWRHVFAGHYPAGHYSGTCVVPGSAGPSATKTNKIQRKPATLSSSLTPPQPASSTQTIENKNTKRRR